MISPRVDWTDRLARRGESPWTVLEVLIAEAVPIAPPFLKTNLAIVVGVDLVKELVQLGSTYGQAGPAEGRPQLILIQPTTVVPVYTLKQLPQLSFSMLDKDPELIVLYPSISRGIHRFEDIVQEVIGVFEGMVDGAKAFLERKEVELPLTARIKSFP